MVDESETLGKYLKNQRESKKISLRAVAKNTRVREHLLRAIEEDQYQVLPPTTYVKGFLLAYAKYLKLDPQDVLSRYERILKGEPTPPVPPLTQKPKGEILPPNPLKPEPEERAVLTESSEIKEELPSPPTFQPKPKRLWNPKQAWVVGGVIFASLIAFYLFYPSLIKIPLPFSLEKPFSEKSISEKPVVGITSPETPSEPVAATTVVHPAPSSSSVTGTPSAEVKSPLSIQMKAVEETWISLQLDDQREKEMTFQTGEGISFQAMNRIRIIVGNAGGLELTLNGKQMGQFGKSGEVVTLIITSEGVEAKRPEKRKSPQEEAPR